MRRFCLQGSHEWLHGQPVSGLFAAVAVGLKEQNYKNVQLLHSILTATALLEVLTLGLEEQPAASAHIVGRLVAEARWQTEGCAAQALQVGVAGLLLLLWPNAFLPHRLWGRTSGLSLLCSGSWHKPALIIWAWCFWKREKRRRKGRLCKM